MVTDSNKYSIQIQMNILCYILLHLTTFEPFLKHFSDFPYFLKYLPGAIKMGPVYVGYW